MIASGEAEAEREHERASRTRRGAARSPRAARRAPTGTAAARRRCRPRAGSRRAVVVVVMVVCIAVPVRVGVARPAREHGGSDADHHQAGGEVEPRIEPVGDDPLREQEGHAAEREHAGGVGRGRDQPEQRRVPRCAARADEVGGDDRLPVAGRERVRGAPEERERERAEDHERAQMLPADERGEARVRDAVGRRERLARRAAPAVRPFVGASWRRRMRDVERAREQVSSGTRAARPRPSGRRAEDDLLPADTAGVVAVVDETEPSARRAGRRGSPGSVSCAGPPRRAGARAPFAATRRRDRARRRRVTRSPAIRSGTRCSVGISAMSTT